MDETLLRANILTPHNSDTVFDCYISIESKGYQVSFGISLRPYVREMLRRLRDKYEIVVYTAGNDLYSQSIL